MTNNTTLPAGWKLVPEKPTPKMVDAACQDGISLDGRPVWKHTVDVQAEWRWKQMLAAAPQPPEVEQEPVAWAIFVDSGNARMWTTFQPHIQKLADAEGLAVTPLYTHPQPRQPLTNERIDKIAEGMPGGIDGFLKGWGWRQFARAVEAAHKIGGEA